MTHTDVVEETQGYPRYNWPLEPCVRVTRTFSDGRSIYAEAFLQMEWGKTILNAVAIAIEVCKERLNETTEKGTL